MTWQIFSVIYRLVGYTWNNPPHDDWPTLRQQQLHSELDMLVWEKQITDPSNTFHLYLRH